MGSAIIVMHKSLVAALLGHDDVRVTKMDAYGDEADERFLVSVTSALIPEVYKGQLDIVLQDGQVSFKPWSPLWDDV